MIRKDEVEPLLKSTYRGSDYRISPENGLDVTWRFTAGTLRLLANFGNQPLSADVNSNTRVLWSNADPSPAGENIQLSSWKGIIVKEASA
jgi:maltooligosyltrehalose trehalohydrolase